MAKPFRDRTEAGPLLAAKPAQSAQRPDVLVLALPRGGVPVAYEVARALGAPLDVYLVRKLGVPGHKELAMGAIATGGVRVLNEAVGGALHISPATIDAVAAAEQRELARRERLYRGTRPAPDVRGRTVILVDDGLATRATMRAAVAALRQQQPPGIGAHAALFVALTLLVFVLLTVKYGEVAVRYPEGGGVVTVATHALHPFAGLLGGMFILVDYFLTAGLSALSGLIYLSDVAPALRPVVLPATLLALGVLGLLNLIGISTSAKVNVTIAVIASASPLALVLG